MRYIEADALLNKLPDDLPYKASVKRVLMQAPTADVVEVVRCKECKHSEEKERLKADTVRKTAERIKQAICDNTYPDFNKNGKPVNVWSAVNGYDAIDQIAKEIMEDED